jgi:hypothetical protein
MLAMRAGRSSAVIPWTMDRPGARGKRCRWVPAGGNSGVQCSDGSAQRHSRGACLRTAHRVVLNYTSLSHPYSQFRRCHGSRSCIVTAAQIRILHCRELGLFEGDVVSSQESSQIGESPEVARRAYVPRWWLVDPEVFQGLAHPWTESPIPSLLSIMPR